MTDGANLIKTIVDVAAANYTNYGEKPSIKIVHQENLFYKKPSKGLTIMNAGRGDAHQASNAQTIFAKYPVLMTIAETTVARRENLFADVKVLFKNNGVSYTFEYDESYKKPFKIILDIMILGV